MATETGPRAAARGKSAEASARRDQRDAERLAARARERQASDAKIERLRELRLAKEAADRAASTTGAAHKKAAKATAR